MPDIQSVGRKAPDISATKCKIGVKKRGNDENMWEIVSKINGIHRWKKVKVSTKKSSKKYQTRNPLKKYQTRNPPKRF